MKKRIRERVQEEGRIFYTVVKWVFLSVIIGCLVGFSTTIFLKMLGWSTNIVHSHKYYFFLLPFILFLSGLIIKVFAPDAEGHGTEKVIEAVHRSEGIIKVAVIPVKLVATIITLAFGGSAGKEGPSAQIGAGIASSFARIFNFDAHDRKKLVICGISAGFASVFGAPIAGAMFGVEVLFVGNILYDVMLPSFIASVISYNISLAMGINYFHYFLTPSMEFSYKLFYYIIIAGIFFGLCSFGLIEVLKLVKKISNRIKIWKPLKGFIGGIVLIVIALIFSTDYLGLGVDVFESCLKGTVLPWYAFIVKSFATAFTLEFCGSGGILTPIFFIGATAGNIFAQILHLDISVFSALGFVALLAGSANTPIAASILAIELFDAKIAPYAALVCIISFLMTGHRSVYPSQILAFKKSKLIDIDLNKEIDKIKLKM